MPQQTQHLGPRPRRRLGPVVLASGVGLALLTGGLVPATATPGPEPRPGAHSSGDSLFPRMGNGGYDVQHYDVALRYAARTGAIEAVTTVRARARRPLSSYSLDLQQLHVRSVVVDGQPAAFSRRGHKVFVTPAMPVRGRFRTVVAYHGTPVTHRDPDGAKDGWIPTSDGATVLSEPVGAMTWFPNNNTPRDKATFTVHVNVPASRKVAGNGDLVGRRSHAGRTTWTWQQRRPQATYLAMISIGRYHLYRSTMLTTTGRRLPVWSFVAPEYGSLARQRRLIPRIVRFEERRFGPYPNTSVGMVVKHTGVGFALETQNRPTFDGPPDTELMVHELAHQWYGDSATLGDWQDIWLHEGFADYTEKLWALRHGGAGPRLAYHRSYRSHPASDDLWRPAPARFDDPADLFGDPVYVRGGMALQALRQRIGTDDFFTVLRRWPTIHRGGTVRTADFERLAERVSGRDLDRLFRTWLRTPGKPKRF